MVRGLMVDGPWSHGWWVSSDFAGGAPRGGEDDSGPPTRVVQGPPLHRARLAHRGGRGHHAVDHRDTAGVVHPCVDGDDEDAARQSAEGDADPAGYV